MMCSCIEVHAEEIQLFREESGGLEQLQGIELSETELETGLETPMHNAQRNSPLDEDDEYPFWIMDLIMDIGYGQTIKL